jgi:hypothetical protein
MLGSRISFDPTFDVRNERPALSGVHASPSALDARCRPSSPLPVTYEKRNQCGAFEPCPPIPGALVTSARSATAAATSVRIY